MPRSMLALFAMMTLLAGMMSAGPARAWLFIEPEIGGRWVYDMDRLDPGIAVGGNLGFALSPMLAMVAHVDAGFHPGGDLSGESYVLLLGGRLYPLGGNAALPIQPYAGLGGGVGILAWEGWWGDFTESAGLVALEAGGDMKLSRSVSLGVGGRYIMWLKERDPSGNSVNLQAHAGFHF